MGGCASVPKEFANRPESVPVEQAPAKVEEQPESDSVAAPAPAAAAPETTTDGGDKKEVDKEAPLVEVAEPEKEAEIAAEKPTEEVTTETKVEAAKDDSDKDKTDAPLVTV